MLDSSGGYHKKLKEWTTDGVTVHGVANTKVLDADGLTLDDIFN